MNLQRFYNPLPVDVVEQVRGCQAAVTSLGEDKPIWAFTSHGCFTTKSAYDSLLETVFANSKWKKVWTWEGPQRVRCFLWLLYNNGLKTNEKRKRCSLNTSPMCPLCSTHGESLDHLLRNCVVVKQVWQALCPRGIPHSFGQGSLEDWLSSNLDGKSICNDNDWCLTFGIGLWSIWYHRN